MDAVLEEVSGIGRLDRKISILPQVKGIWEVCLTFILAVCTQFHVIICNIIESKCEFAMATQDSNGANLSPPNYNTSLKRSKEECPE